MRSSPPESSSRVRSPGDGPRLSAAALAGRNLNAAFAVALFQGLLAGGVRHVCICPGSRSAPLATAARATEALACHVHLDERSAAFFALGLARAGGGPVALVCTSGTAAANFLPAVAEADLSRVSLVVLSADRPPEVRGFGAPQTIVQPGLFAGHVRFAHDAAVPRPGLDVARYGAALGARAAHEATGRMPGPVHLNLPFDEPLDPAAAPAPDVQAPSAAAAAPAPALPPLRQCGQLAPSPDLVAALALEMASAERGVIVCGPQDAGPDLAEGILALGHAADWPVLAELTSQLPRSGGSPRDPLPRAGGSPRGPLAGRGGALEGPLVSRFDALLRDAAFAAAHAPDRVLRFGALPTSKACQAWLAAHPAAHVSVVDATGGRVDPGHRVDAWLEVDPGLLCRRVADRLARRSATRRLAGDPAWRAAWIGADKQARAAQRIFLDGRAALQGLGAAEVLLETLPDGATLYLSNSLSVRDAEAVAVPRPGALRVLANRGANGIDGVISSALGAACARPEAPAALLIGDLAFLHDVSVLARVRALGASLSIVLLNDDGGGIFSHLPIAAHGAAVAFEELFRVPHGLDLGALCRGFGVGHLRVADAAALRRALLDSFAAPGVQVIEVPLDAAENLAEHRAYHAALARAAREGVAP